VGNSPAEPTKPRILIVEDEVLVRMYAVDVLADEGFNVTEAGSGAEALAKVQASAGFTAVIIDLGLPDRSGDLIAADIRALYPALPVLIASGRSERELKERFGNDARVGIVVKPFTAPMLLEALAQLGVSAPSGKS
jgi:CheY-like chemotaxis protein